MRRWRSMTAARTRTARRRIRRTRSRDWCARRCDASPVSCCAKARRPTMHTQNYSLPRLTCSLFTIGRDGPLPGPCPSMSFRTSSVTPRYSRPRFTCARSGSACSMQHNLMRMTKASAAGQLNAGAKRCGRDTGLYSTKRTERGHQPKMLRRPPSYGAQRSRHADCASRLAAKA